MKIFSHINTRFLSILGASICLVPIQNAYSQEDVVIEEIFITGSRIKGGPETAAQPTNYLDAEAFAASGNMTVSEALNELPQLSMSFGANTQDINSLNSGFNAGTSLVNLRGLGTERTLVLVNGRRHVGADPGKSSVDLNSIPSAMIERIEVVTGANSAIYGADAVTGVVNIILKTDYEGTELSVRRGESSEGDATESFASIVHGGQVANGRGSYLISAELSDNDGFLGSDREFSQFDGSNSSYSVGGTAGSSAAVGGRWTTDAGAFTYEDGGLTGWSNDSRFQRIAARSLSTPVERQLVSGKFDFDISDTTKFFVEGTYSNTEATVVIEPQFFWFRGRPPGSQFEAPVIPDDNPFLQQFLADANATSLNDSSFNLRRLSEYGIREAITDRDLFRIAVGFTGRFNEFDYEVYYQHGSVDAKQTDTNAIDRNRFFAGLNGCAVGDGTYGLAGVDYAALGCTAVDLFGRNTITQDFIDYSLIPGVSSSTESSQDVLSGFITGELFDLPAGAVSFVIGAEYREEDTDIDVHPSYFDGSNAIRQITATSGDIDVTDVFGEFKVPLIENRWDISGSLRYSDYSAIDAQTTWGLNSNITISDSIRVRLSIGEATRSPSVSDLFSSVVDTTAVLSDPCANDFDLDGIAEAATPAACAAELGDGYVITEDGQSILRNRTGGNMDLDPETASTFSAGLVLTPTDNLSITVDYYDIEIEDVIGSISSATVLNECYGDVANPFFCPLVDRFNAGALESVNSQIFNAAESTIEGIDLQAFYTVDALAGRWTTSLNWTHLLERSRVEFPGAEKDDFTGRIDAIENVATLGLNYMRDAWSIDWTVRYLDSAEAGTSDANREAEGNNISSIAYHDLRGSYDFGESVSVSLGIKNLEDKQPPLITQFSNADQAVAGTSTTAAGVYDVRERFFYMDASYRF